MLVTVPSNVNQPINMTNLMGALMSDSELNFRYGEQLAQTVRQIVCKGAALDAALHEANIPEQDHLLFAVAVGDAVGNLDVHNCVDLGLSVEETDAWIKAGRPAGSSSSVLQPDYTEDPGAVIQVRGPA